MGANGNKGQFVNYAGMTFENGVQAIKHINKRVWICKCPRCGKDFETDIYNVRAGKTSSCGCLKAEVARQQLAIYRPVSPYTPQQAKDRKESKRLQRTLGISLEDKNRMFEEQGGKCAICGNEQPQKSLAADHDHKTGKMRRLLCHRCNVGIGLFEDDISLLEKAMRYLRGK